MVEFLRELREWLNPVNASTVLAKAQQGIEVLVAAGLAATDRLEARRVETLAFAKQTQGKILDSLRPLLPNGLAVQKDPTVLWGFPGEPLPTSSPDYDPAAVVTVRIPTVDGGVIDLRGGIGVPSRRRDPNDDSSLQIPAPSQRGYPDRGTLGTGRARPTWQSTG